MSQLREAAQQALEALEYIHEGAKNQRPHTGISWQNVSTISKPAIFALRAALSEEAMQRLTDVQQEREQKPVAWGLDISFQDKIGTGQVTFKKHDDLGFVIPLYAAPPKREWVSLTDEEVKNLPWNGWALDLARAIEQLLKEKNS